MARLDALDDLIAAVARLEEKAFEELQEERAWLRLELSRVEAELAELAGRPALPTGKPVPAKGADSVAKKSVTLPELIAELQAAPDRTLNIRKANLDAKTVKALVKSRPQLLKLGGKSGWPTVTLLERPEEKPPGVPMAAPQPELFD